MLDILPTPSLSDTERSRPVIGHKLTRWRQVHVFRLDSGNDYAFFGRKCCEDTLAEFVEWQIAEGSSALVPCGTTGESATLTRDEHRQVIAATVRVANGRVPVIAGCGSYSTAAASDMARTAAEVGADAVLVVVPYYNKPSQAGIAAHYLAIAEASPLPIVVYNVPSRTVADISVETLAKISEHPRIVAIKDATGNLARVSAQRIACGEAFIQLSGNDDMALGFNAMGGTGCISVTANVAPRLCADFQAATRKGAGMMR